MGRILSMMDTESRIKVLQEQHQQLEENLSFAEKSLQGNDRINFIKRRKLHIKDEITRLEKEISND